MSADPRESSASQGDDLFDLPSEAPRAREVASTTSPAAGMDLDKPSSALPRRAPSTSPAGPPLTTVPSTPSGIQEQIRARAKMPAPIAPAPALPTPKVARVPKITPLTGMWIAFAAFALVTGWGLGSIVVKRSTATSAPTEQAKSSEHTASNETATPNEHAHSNTPAAAAEHAMSNAAALPTELAPATVVEPTTASHTTQTVVPANAHAPTASPVALPVVAHTPPPAPVISDAERLEAARSALTAAREEMAAGRRGAARTRLARIGLTADAIQPSARESIRAEAALLLAQCIQAEADEAVRTP